MSITKEKKSDLMKGFQIHKKDTGSSEVQIALLTERISYLTEHLRANKKDKHSGFGLLRMVERRKKLLVYLSRTNPTQYAKIIERLDLRK